MPLLTTARIYDPAIRLWNGRDGVRLEEWLKDGREVEKLQLRPGARLRVYHFERLTRSQMLFVEKADHEVTARDRAFALGVRRIDREDGTTWEPAGVHAQGYFGISEAELDAMEFPDIQEIGGAVLARSRVPFGCAVTYPVPPSSLAVLDGVLSRFAARSQADAAPSRSEPAAPSEG